MTEFSQKSLIALGDCYVYGLIDPRDNTLFYIGKGSGNRVFQHEFESLNNPDSEKLKLKTISEIKENGMEVKKVILNAGLSESEAFVAEAALINAFNYVGMTRLTNIQSGHHFTEALSVEEFEKEYGAEELNEDDIKHKTVVIIINKLYRRGMTDEELYDVVRGCWKLNLERARKCEYVFGVYNALIVAVYKPTEWFICSENPDRLPERDKDTPFTDRKFFVDEDFEKGNYPDDNEKFYLWKSIKNVERIMPKKGKANPILYFD